MTRTVVLGDDLTVDPLGRTVECHSRGADGLGRTGARVLPGPDETTLHAEIGRPPA